MAIGFAPARLQNLAEWEGGSESNADVRIPHTDPGVAMISSGEMLARQQPFHFLELIAAAEGQSAVLSAIQSYLNAWPTENIASLQRVDGGWAPFDSGQRPLQVDTLEDLIRFREAVRRQCVALKQANLQLTPEIVELDEMLSIASQFAQAMRSTQFKHSAEASKRSSLLKLL